MHKKVPVFWTATICRLGLGNKVFWEDVMPYVASRVTLGALPQSQEVTIGPYF